MNSFTYKHKKGEPATVDMIVSTSLLNCFKEHLDIDIELLKGFYKCLENEMHHCILQVSGQKREIFEDFIKGLVAHKSMTVTIMGLPVYKN